MQRMRNGIKAGVKAVAVKKPINKGSKKGQFRSAPYHFLSGSRSSDAYHPNTDTNFRGYNQQIDTNLLTAVQVAPAGTRRIPKPTDICFRCRPNVGIRDIGKAHAQPSTEISKLINKTSSSSVCDNIQTYLPSKPGHIHRHSH